MNIIIGTYALFQASVIFKNLGLAVIDEQQRFEVMQRNCVISKGENADILFVLQMFIEKLESAINRGEKAYWICSYIEENEGLNIAAVEMRFQELQKTFFDKVRIIYEKLTQD
nr:hypothetical protein [Wolbachia endosymbiont of Litomosoides sigmodontis]